MSRLGILLLLSLCVGAFSGCSVFYAFTAPKEKDLTIADLGAAKSVVDNAWGPAQTCVKEGDQTKATYSFVDGYPVWSNVLRGLAWTAGDFFTLCLAEVITWPVELTMREVASTVVADVVYDSNDTVVSSVVRDSSGNVLVRDGIELEEVQTEVAFDKPEKWPGDSGIPGK